MPGSGSRVKSEQQFFPKEGRIIGLTFWQVFSATWFRKCDSEAFGHVDSDVFKLLNCLKDTDLVQSSIREHLLMLFLHSNKLIL